MTTQYLSERQQQVFDFICRHYEAHGICPSTRQMAEAFAVCQTAIVSVVTKLVSKGAIQKDPQSGRILVRDHFMQELQVARARVCDLERQLMEVKSHRNALEGELARYRRVSVQLDFINDMARVSVAIDRKILANREAKPIAVEASVARILHLLDNA